MRPRPPLRFLVVVNVRTGNPAGDGGVSVPGGTAIQDVRRRRAGDTEPSGGCAMTTRRKVIVYAVSASTLTLAVPLGVGGPTTAEAEFTPRRPGARPPTAVAVGTDAEKLVLEVTAANRVVVRLPRVE